jgi:hypothetical protein
MKKRKLQILCAATVATFLLAPLGTAVAEEVGVSVKNQVQRGLQEDLPRTGLSESSVRNRWGEPQSTTGPVGEPPIRQWHYEDFVVYFEGDRVIHSVLMNDR